MCTHRKWLESFPERKAGILPAPVPGPRFNTLPGSTAPQATFPTRVEMLASLARVTDGGSIDHARCDHTCWLTIQLFRPVASSNDPRIGESLATTAAIPAAGWCAPSHAWKEHPCQGSNLTSLPFRYIESGIHAWGKHATTQHLLHLGCDLSCSTPA